VNEDESLVRACGYPRELGSRDVSPNDVGYRHINRTPPYYKRYIFPKGLLFPFFALLFHELVFIDARAESNGLIPFPLLEHDNYLVALEDGKEPAILSVESSSAKRQGKKLVYKAILRTARVIFGAHLKKMNLEGEGGGRAETRCGRDLCHLLIGPNMLRATSAFWCKVQMPTRSPRSPRSHIFDARMSLSDETVSP